MLRIFHLNLTLLSLEAFSKNLIVQDDSSCNLITMTEIFDYFPQFYIQLVYRAPFFITLKIEIWVSNIRKYDL